MKRPRPCSERHPDPTTTASECGICLLYLTREDYHRHWGGPGLPVSTLSVPRKARVPLPTCRHLGEDTGRRVPCGLNKGCKAKVFACGVHGECVLGEAAGMKSCRGCEQFEARDTAPGNGAGSPHEET